MNISAIQNAKAPLKTVQNAVAFKGGYAASRELTKQISQNSNKFIKTITNLGLNNGEILNTIVTAIGTACVAPIFIAFNPFSKEDKETKIYSAMRQPISAAIALCTQIGVNTKFNKWLDKLASTGQLERANLKASPKNSYLKSLVKLKNPQLSKADLEAETIAQHDEAFWRQVNTTRKEMKNAEIKYEDLIDSDAYKKAKSIVKSEFAENISKMSKKEAKEFIESETIKTAAKTIEETLRNEAQIKFNLGKLANSQKQIDELIEEISKGACDLIDVNDKQAARMIEKLRDLQDTKAIKNLGDTFEEVLQNVKIKKFVKAGVNNAEDVLKSSKKWGGIVLSMITLPFSCGLLNWAYPRIMEKLMPDVVAAKKAKGGK